ncbi:NCS1 family transporter (plasmid) [Nicoliella spurrieriana]|uniref:NCS1 family transporter n=1 Tax=Nicoliella spurrieriana TaxID=2925830 RepID=A0A976RR01_9LACO|nr:NCS1 family transporter [Nicoliella spurrieriana]UQS86031.1 NCS1 family transporter [Nicoliella spurrieriana]
MQSVVNNEEISPELTIPDELLPIKDDQRKIGKLAYMSMWLGDGFNIGNITVGSSIVVAGVATMNLLQTVVAAAIAIAIVSLIFALNDRFGYETGVPYVMQLRLSFGKNGAKFSSLFRGVPSLVWFGFQSWTGALALNEIAKIITNNGFNNVAICFTFLMIVQLILSIRGFKFIKNITSVVSVIMMVSLLSLFIILLVNHGSAISQTLVQSKGSWGIQFFGFIVAFLGNYTAIFESAADYSRELKPGISNCKRGFLYFLPIGFSYGITLLTGAMLSAVTGIASPVDAMSHIFNNHVIMLLVSLFIVLGVITTNAVANITPTTYVLTSLLKLPRKLSLVLVTGLAVFTCPWLLVGDSSSQGLTIFIHSYAIFLGPLTAIILIEYYIVRKRKVDLDQLYRDDIRKINWKAFAALIAGALFALTQIELSWLIGFAVSAVVYLTVNKLSKSDTANII